MEPEVLRVKIVRAGNYLVGTARCAVLHCFAYGQRSGCPYLKRVVFTPLYAKARQATSRRVHSPIFLRFGCWLSLRNGISGKRHVVICVDAVARRIDNRGRDEDKHCIRLRHILFIAEQAAHKRQIAKQWNFVVADA